MSTFLQGLGWASAIDSAEAPKKSNYEKLVVLAAMLAGLGTFLPDTIRQSLVNTILTANTLVVVVFIMVVSYSMFMFRRLGPGSVEFSEVLLYRKRLGVDEEPSKIPK
jgi:hypothetical protein